ncbi:MAG TPA: hypothetical protein DCW74_19705 [Alteromonas australica]|uniref:Uncharacterized protein n=1 Tax=Alteromonas australica TaxID=589873 RepID=A0A350P9I2_9ALTE|nr:hypothetical protein [Alteromonas australica]|tara:strand:- start:2675 stop:2869 length:195 start_codon:yes stop_codon:yes gene_type:complete
MTKIKNACNLIAEHLKKVKIDEDLYSEMKFIRADLLDYLLCEGNQEELLQDFKIESKINNKKGL